MTSIGPQKESKEVRTEGSDPIDDRITISDTEKEDPQESFPFPDGGARAWLVALGGGGVMFCTFGYINAFGVLQEYYQLNQLKHKSPSDISWIGSLQIFFLFAGGLSGGPLFDRYGAIVLWPAATVHVLAVMMTSLCKEYYQFILAQGILGGVGIGMSITPAFAATGHYFQKKRAAAMGISVAGSSLGGVIWPIMLTKMLPNPRLQFGWTIRIFGFIMLAIMGFSCAVIRARLPSRKGQFFLPAAFKEVPYLTLILATFMILLGIFVPPFYLPSFAVSNGMSTKLAPYLISIYNGASLFGRVIPGILADKLGRYNIYFAAAISSAVLGFCWQRVTSNAAVIVFAAFYGFCSGAIVSMMSVCFTMIPKDPKTIGTYLGMGLAAASVATLIGPPISGAILSHENFSRVSDFSGSVSLAGGLILVLVKYSTGNGLLSKF